MAADKSPGFAIVRLSTWDEAEAARAVADVDEFRRRHASQPGFAGSITVDVGEGRRVAVNLWKTERDADAARHNLRSAIDELLGGVMTNSELIGSGPIVEFDLAGRPGQPPPLRRIDDA